MLNTIKQALDLIRKDLGDPVPKNMKEWQIAAGIVYIEHGLPVIPVGTSQGGGEKLPKGKKNDSAYTDPDKFEEAMRTKYKASSWNIGIMMGAISGIVCVDIDIKKGHQGFESLSEVSGTNDYIKDLAAPFQRSRSGGGHLFYRIPKGKKYTNKAGWRDGLDIFGESQHINCFPRKGYEWEKFVDDLTDAPKWVPFAIGAKGKPKGDGKEANDVPKGMRGQRGLEDMTKDDTDEIQHGEVRRKFCDMYSIGEVLDHFPQHFKKVNDDSYISSLSSSGNAGINILPPNDDYPVERVVSHHADDPIKGFGQGLDAFALYAWLHHTLDVREGGEKELFTHLARQLLASHGEEIDPPYQMTMDKDGNMNYKKTQFNYTLAFLTTGFRNGHGRFVHDEFDAWTYIEGNFRTRPMTDVSYITALEWIERWSPLPYSNIKGFVEGAIERTKMINKRDSLKDYFDKLPRHSGKVSYFDKLADYLKLEGIQRIYLRKWLIGGVARALVPASKVENLLILQGKQGIGKSRWLEALCPSVNWFTDSIENLSGFNKKDELQKLKGSFIVELAELHAFKARGQSGGLLVSEVKGFLSTTQDKYRAPFEKTTQLHPRRCIFAGTTNEDTFLTDTTGSRRNLVISLGETRLPVEWTKKNRQGLWAEMKLAFEAGEIWHLTDDETIAQEALNKSYYGTDPWHSEIIEWARTKTNFKAPDVLRECIGMSEDRWTRVHSTRVHEVLTFSGYAYKVRKIGNRTHKVFINPNDIVEERYRKELYNANKTKHQTQDF